MTRKKKERHGMKILILTTVTQRGKERLVQTLYEWKRLFRDVSVVYGVLGTEINEHDGRIGLNTVLKLKSKQSMWRNDGIHLTHINQVACALSHLSIWEDIARTGEPAVVVEDDVFPMFSPQELLRACKGEMFVSLYAACMPHAATILDQSDTFWGFQAYYMTPQAAKLLIPNFLPVSMHCDRYLAAHVEHTKDTRFKIAQPQLACRIVGESTLEHATDRLVKTLILFWTFVCVLIVMIIVQTVRLKACRKRALSFEARCISTM